MVVVPGSASTTIAVDLAKQLNLPLAKTSIKRFPDTELYVRILDDLTDKDVIIVQTTYPDPNIIELFLLQDAVHEANAKTITVIIPYFGYGRQDKKFEEGEAISARALAEHIGIHADNIITVDPHKEHLLNFFKIPSASCSALREIAAYLKENKEIDLVLAPDKGARERAKKVSGIIGFNYDSLDKIRIDGHTVQMTPKHLDVQKKNVVIIDDIISTGGTMAQAVKELKKQGAKEISLACTHGLFVGNAKEKITAAGCNDIISTDTIQTEYSKVKVASCIAQVIKKNHQV